MPYNPRPEVIFGQFALCEPIIGDDGIPRLSLDEATLIGSASIDWGRDNHWAQSEPATLTFQFFDPGTNWAIKIGSGGAIGIGVTMAITLPTGHGIAEAVGDRFTLFQGVTAKVEAERTHALTTSGRRPGWIVTVTAGDRSSSLGNVPFTWQDWPSERMIDRAIRLRDQAAGTGIRQIYFDASHINGTVKAVEVRDKTGLDIAHDLYASFGHQWTYHPNRNVVIRIPEHEFPDTPFLQDQGNGDVLPAMPDLTDWTGTEASIDRAAHVGIALDGCTVESDTRMSTDQVGNLTRIEAKWNNRHDSNRPILTYSVKVFAVAPFRTMSFESWFDDGIQLDAVLNRTANKAFFQQSGPHHPAVTYRTAPFGGFPDVKRAIWFLTAAERRGYAFLSGSPWIADIGGVPPTVTPCGGRIAYAGGEWTVTSRLLRGHRTTIGQGLSWSGQPAGLSWNGPTGRRYGEAVTWGDTWFVRDATIRNA